MESRRTISPAAIVLAIIALVVAVPGLFLPVVREVVVEDFAAQTYQGNVYREQGGDKLIAASGGEIEAQSGSTFDLQAGVTTDFSSGVDLDGSLLDLDADGDTSIQASTDDQIDIEISAADDFRFTANTFTALAGSTVQANTLDDTSGGTVTVNAAVAITGALDVQGGDITLENDEYIDNSTNGTVAFVVGTTPEYSMTATLLDLGGNSLDLDADGDTSITADTDDQIDIEISAADDFQFTANTFTILAGSKIDSASVTTGTHGVVFNCSASHGHASAEAAVSMCSIPANANVVDVLYQVTTQWNDGATATVDCGIEGGDVDAFVDAMNINDAADGNRMGDAADMPFAASFVDVGASDVDVICQVAEGNNDASAGAATLVLWYIID